MQGASMAQTQSNALALPQTAQAPELGSGWRCVKSEDYGQTYIFGVLSLTNESLVPVYGAASATYRFVFSYHS